MHQIAFPIFLCIMFCLPNAESNYRCIFPRLPADISGQIHAFYFALPRRTPGVPGGASKIRIKCSPSWMRCILEHSLVYRWGLSWELMIYWNIYNHQVAPLLAIPSTCRWYKLGNWFGYCVQSTNIHPGQAENYTKSLFLQFKIVYFLVKTLNKLWSGVNECRDQTGKSQIIKISDHGCDMLNITLSAPNF